MALSRKRKIILTVLGALFLGFLVLYACLVLVDGPAPDDSHLQIERREVADSDNGFSLVELDSETLADVDRKPGTLAEGGVHFASIDIFEGDDSDPEDEVDWEWDSDSAKAALVEHADLLDRLEASLARADFVSPDDQGFGAEQPYLMAWRQLATLLSMRLRLHLEDDEPRAAYEDALRQLRFGHRIAGSQGNLITYLIGCSIHSAALQNLLGLVPRSPPDAATGRWLLDELGKLAPEISSMTDAIRIEYLSVVEIVDATVTGRLEEVFGEDAEGAPGHGWGPLYRLLPLNPNDTRRLFVDNLTPLIEGAEVAWKDRPACDTGEDPESGVPDATVSIGSFEIAIPLRNAIGRILYGLMAFTSNGVASSIYKLEFLHSATRLVVALRLWQLEHGDLPASLNELVPAVIDAVPRDPYDGAPMRYSRERRIVYSVGADLEDDGGVTLEDPRRVETEDEEPTCRVSF